MIRICCLLLMSGLLGSAALGQEDSTTDADVLAAKSDE